MKGVLVRVGIDQSAGRWNGPFDSKTNEFLYVPIPETRPSHPGLNRPYTLLVDSLAAFGSPLPEDLSQRDMHLDPDFENFTYGDQGERAKQISGKVGDGDLLVFYAGLRDRRSQSGLCYALIGLFVVNEIIPAVQVPPDRWYENAHTRRIMTPQDGGDVIVRAHPKVSGRLARGIPIGDYRNGAYRVWPDLLNAWGGLGVKNGYLQRSARLPELTQADRFYRWLQGQNVNLLASNN